MLDGIYDVAVRFPRRHRDSNGAVGESLRQSVELDEAAFGASIDNLYRLRLAAPPSVSLDSTTDKTARYQLTGHPVVCLTDFGETFVRACRPPAQSLPRA